jgi:hypothetical protein
MDCRAITPSPTPSLQTQVGMEKVSSVCSTGMTGNILTGLFVRTLRDHFSSADNLEFNGANYLDTTIELQRYVWSDGPETKLQIQSVWEYNTQDIQNRPALYVKRNRFQTQKTAMGDGYTVAPNTDSDGRVRNVPGRYQTRAILGSHTIFCVGGAGAEVELLGWEVFNLFHQFAQVFREEFRMHRFEVSGVEGVGLLEEFDYHFVVPVVVAYAYYAAWRIDVEAPWLKTVSINVNPQ